MNALALGPLSPYETEFRSALFDASESAYQSLLFDRVAESARLGDVFGWMVARNVPAFIIQQHWPTLLPQVQQSSGRLAFAVAEAGWRGRLENLRSIARVEGESLRVRLQKNYIMSCDLLLSLVRDEGGQLRLLCLSAPEALPLLPREEAELSLSRGDAPPLRHFTVDCDLELPLSQSIVLEAGAYRKSGVQIPRREYTSLAIIAPALLLAAGRELPTSIAQKRAELLSARDGARLGGAEHGLARAILDEFFQAAAQAKLELHPLLLRMRRLFESQD